MGLVGNTSRFWPTYGKLEELKSEQLTTPAPNALKSASPSLRFCAAAAPGGRGAPAEGAPDSALDDTLRAPPGQEFWLRPGLDGKQDRPWRAEDAMAD